MAPNVIIKKENKNKKHVIPSKVEADTNAVKPWPDLPQKLINTISWQSSLMLDTSYGGVTKSWRTQTKQCNSKATLPWLELYDCNDDTRFKFAISFHEGEWNRSTWHWNRWPWQPPWNYYVGCSDGLLIGKGASRTDYYLHFYTRGACYGHLPPWDERVPFKRAVISSLTRDPYWRDCVLMVLTGISQPAFVFYRQKAGAKHEWIKQDCNIADPHCCNKSEKQVGFMRFTNAIGYKGKFYALSLQGTLAVIEDIDSQPRIMALGPKRAVPSVCSRHFKECLLESEDEILLVFLICRKSVNIVDAVEVFRLDIGALSWTKIERIGDRTLFLGSNCCMSVSATKMRCTSDCVYFRNETSDAWWVYDFRRRNFSSCHKDEILPQDSEFRLNQQLKSNFH